MTITLIAHIHDNQYIPVNGTTFKQNQNWTARRKGTL